jgi:hypothetical protein
MHAGTAGCAIQLQYYPSAAGREPWFHALTAAAPCAAPEQEVMSRDSKMQHAKNAAVAHQGWLSELVSFKAFARYAFIAAVLLT